MQFSKLFILCTILTLSLFPINSIATSLEQSPSSESSKQWKVVIDKPDNNDVKPKPDVYNVYSMDIKNIGNEEIKIVRVEAFRDEPNSSTDFELFTADYEKETNMDLEPSFHHQNFPMSVQAKYLKVIITWKKETDKSIHPRLFREEFVFEQ